MEDIKELNEEELSMVSGGITTQISYFDNCHFSPSKWEQGVGNGGENICGFCKYCQNNQLGFSTCFITENK